MTHDAFVVRLPFKVSARAVVSYDGGVPNTYREQMGSTQQHAVEDRPVALLVGASGQVGAQMRRLLEAAPEKPRPLLSSSREREGWLRINLAELEGQEQVEQLLGSHSLSMIFCIGAMTDVEGCEGKPDLAERTNARGPAVLARYAHRRNLPFVYFSTEYVFDGSREEPGPYLETSPTHALSVYGKSKLNGECAVLAAHTDALILRTTVVYGQDSQEKNYLYSVLRNLAGRRSMKVPEDQISTPTFSEDLVHATLGLIEANASGVFHLCGPERVGRLDFAVRIANHFGLDTSLLYGVPTRELGQKAPRPLHAGLSIEKLTSGYPHLRMRTLAESLESCTTELVTFIEQVRAEPSVAERKL